MTFLDPIDGRSNRGPARVARTLAVLLVFFMVVEVSYPFGSPAGAEFDRGENAAWIGARWSNTLVQSSERAEMLSRLQEHGVKWIYAEQGALRTDGSLPSQNFMYAGGLVEAAHVMRQRMNVLAWIAGGGRLSLSDEKVRQRIVQVCKYFVEQQGFDGVHLDFEAAPSGGAAFLSLLDEMRFAIGGKKISVVAKKWAPFALNVGRFNPLPSTWDSDYYREVAKRADQVVLVGHDTGIPFANVYIKYLGWQTSELLDALRDVPRCDVLIGVPGGASIAWDPRARAENIGSGLQGVTESLRDMRRSGTLPSNFAGVALFAEWNTTPDEWSAFDRLWRGKP
jgi:hypothetical protein